MLKRWVEIPTIPTTVWMLWKTTKEWDKNPIKLFVTPVEHSPSNLQQDVDTEESYIIYT